MGHWCARRWILALSALAFCVALTMGTAPADARSKARGGAVSAKVAAKGVSKGRVAAKGGARGHVLAQRGRRGHAVAARRAWTRPAVAARPAPAPAPVAPLVAEPPAPAVVVGQAVLPLAIGGVASTSARAASDLAAVLDSDSLRILPTVTRASLADVFALAKADKADLAFLHSDALATLGSDEKAAAASRLACVARLYNEEVHVVAGRATASLADLNGKRVNVGPQGSGNAQTAQIIFDRLGLTPRVVNMDQPTALAALAAGEIAATVVVSGRPVKALQDFAGDGRFRLLGVPYEPALQDLYLPARIEAADYGDLVPPGQTVDTLAVPVVLAAIDAPPGSLRAARVVRFTQALFEKFDGLRDPLRHAKWRDVNLAADVADWPRFPAARDAIERATARSVGVEPKGDPFAAAPASEGGPK